MLGSAPGGGRSNVETATVPEAKKEKKWTSWPLEDHSSLQGGPRQLP